MLHSYSNIKKNTTQTGEAGEPAQEQTRFRTGVSEVAAFAAGAVIFPTIFFTFTRSAVPAVVSSVRLDAAALGTLVHHLSRFELQALDEFFRSVPFGHGSLSKKGGKKRRGRGIYL